MNLNALIIALALATVGGQATAQSLNCYGSGTVRTCTDEEGNGFQQFGDAGGVTTFSTEGDIYRTQRMGGGRTVTNGSDGSSYQTQRVGPGMKVTTDREGNQWQHRWEGDTLILTNPSGDTSRCRRDGSGRMRCSSY